MYVYVCTCICMYVYSDVQNHYACMYAHIHTLRKHTSLPSPVCIIFGSSQCIIIREIRSGCIPYAAASLFTSTGAPEEPALHTTTQAYTVEVSRTYTRYNTMTRNIITLQIDFSMITRYLDKSSSSNRASLVCSLPFFNASAIDLSGTLFKTCIPMMYISMFSTNDVHIYV